MCSGVVSNDLLSSLTLNASLRNLNDGCEVQLSNPYPNHYCSPYFGFLFSDVSLFNISDVMADYILQYVCHNVMWMCEYGSVNAVCHICMNLPTLL